METNQDPKFEEDERDVKFVKRSGVDNEGAEYEIVMIALYALKLALQENVSDMLVATNLDEYGVFDDVVIRVEYKKGRRPELYLVQLKNKMKDISTNELSKKGDFSLKKYKDCYFKNVKKKLEDADRLTRGISKDDVVMCLLTNVDAKGSCTFPLESHVACSKFPHNHPGDFINTKSDGRYKFEKHRSFPKRSQFLHELLRGNFCTEISRSIHDNHPQWVESATELTEIMSFFRGELMKKFKQGSDSYESIIEQIPAELNKNKQANAMTLERYRKVKVVAAYFRKGLKAALIIFDSKSNEDDEYKRFVSDVFETDQRLEREIRCSDREFFKNVSTDRFTEVLRQYRKDGMRNSKAGGNRSNDSLTERIEKYIRYKYKLEKEAEYLAFFEHFFFYVRQVNVKEAEAKIASLVKTAFGEDETNVTERFVKFVKTHFKPTRFSPLTKRHVKMKLLELLMGLDDPKQLAQKYKVFENVTNMQNYEQRLRVLREVRVSIQGRQEVNLAEMTGERFHKKIPAAFLLRNVGRVIGVGLSEDVRRTEVYVKRKFFKILLRSDVIHNTEHNVFLFQEKSGGADVMGSSQKLSAYNYVKRSLIVMLGRRRVSETVEDIREQKNRKNSPIHFLREFGGKYLEWQRSWGSVKDLGDFVVENECVDEKDALRYFKNDLNVVSAAPGMGKTTTLHVLAKYCPPDVFVLKLDLNARYKDLRENDELKKSPLNYLWNLARSSSTVQEIQIFEDELFGYSLEENRLMVFIDAFDEIISESAVLETTFSIIEELRRRQITVWLFTRPLALPHIQHKYGILPVNMAGFTEEDIAFYLSKKVSTAQQMKLSKFVTGNSLTLYSVPHYLQMLVSVCDQPVSLEKLNVTDLYGLFVRMIFNKYHQVRGIDLQRNNINVNTLYDKYASVHKAAALCVFFGGKYLVENRILGEAELKDVLSKFGECENNYGLVVAVRDGVPIFSHRTYAEYWTALWLFDNYTPCSKHDSYNCAHRDKHRRMYEYLLDPQFKSIRLMFDIVVTKEKPIHSAVLEGDFVKVRTALTTFSKDTYVDKFGRTPLHLAMSYIFGPDNESIIVPKGIVKQLVDYAKANNCCLHQSDALLGWNWYKYARATGSKDLLYDAAEWGIPEILQFMFQPSRRCFSKCDRKILPALFFALWRSNGKRLETRVNVEDSDSRTVLHVASFFGNVSCVQYLLKVGADVNSETRTKRTPLHLAAQKGHVDVLKLLCDKGGKVNAPDSNKHTPLHLASFHGNPECVRYLIEKGADVNSRIQTNGDTPIRVAVKQGHLSVLKLLHAKMGRANDFDEDKRSLLHAATLAGRIECVRYLIGVRCDVNAETKSGDTSLHLASYRGYADILKLLSENGGKIDGINSFGKTPLHEAILQGHIECVRYLTQVGADVNVIDKNGYSPVHFAAYQEHVEFLKLLSQNGGDVNKANRQGLTPLHVVAGGGRIESLKYLIEFGAELDLRDEKGHTPMHLAASKGHVDSLRLLVENGADVNLRDSKGRTSLHAASFLGHVACVQYLIRAGFFADDRTECEEGSSAMCLAVKGGHAGVLKVLAEAGGDFNLADSYGRTPLDLAVEYGRTECLRYLLGMDADVHLDVVAKRKLIRLAAREGHAPAHKLLSDVW